MHLIIVCALSFLFYDVLLRLVSGRVFELEVDVRAELAEGVGDDPDHQILERAAHAGAFEQIHGVIERTDAGQNDLRRACESVAGARGDGEQWRAHARLVRY